MGLIIYGTAPFGRVDAQDAEYAHTSFAHLNFVPLYPVQSFWVMGEQGGERFGFPIKRHDRSVLAAYLRVWAPGLAAFMFILSASLPAMAACAVLIGMWAWSWTWWSRRGGHARRRGDFDRVALGSRCPPAQLTDEMTERLERELKARLARRSDPRPPDDVARFGAQDLEEAVIAYGLLRLSEIRRPAEASADRLLASTFESLPSDGGPYRDRLASRAPELTAAISAIAQAETVRAGIHADRTAGEPRWFLRLWVQVAGLLVVTPLLWSIVSSPGLGILGPRTIGAAELESYPPYGQRVVVRCDRAEDEPPQVLETGHVDQRVTLCWLGRHVLLVVSADGEVGESLVAEGIVRDVLDERWARVVNKHLPLDVRSYRLYLASGDDFFRRATIAIVVSLALMQIAGWVLWIRGFRRRRRGRLTRSSADG